MKEFSVLSNIKVNKKLFRIVSKPSLIVGKDEALLTNKITFFDFRYKTIITSNKAYINKKNIILISDEAYEYLAHYDIVMLTSDKLIVLWKYSGHDNCFFLTDACSAKCIMCPQPPKSHDAGLESLNFKLLDLIPKSYANDICLTGGEPTLYNDYYLSLLSKIRDKFPNNFIITLSNGKSFSNLDFINKFMNIKSKSIVAVSFPSDIEKQFNEIMGINNSFLKTHQGIYNLAKANQPVELRVVISKINYKRLPAIADYIYRNYPFAVHIAFMGLEYTGYAANNYEQVYINPVDYKKELEDCVLKLYRYGMNVSVYNIPLCLLDPSIHTFARQSISKWKNKYIEECSKCRLIDECCGVFATSNNYQYSNIHFVD